MSNNNILKIIMDTSKPNLCESNQHQHQSEILEIENLFLKQMFKKKIINSIDSLIDQALNVQDENKNKNSCPI